MVDSLNIAKKWLIAEGTTLFSAIGDADTPANSRCWFEELSPKWINTSLDALVISLDNEETEGAGGVHDCILVVWAYAASNGVEAARTLYRLVWDRLHLASGTTSAGNIEQVTHASALGVRTDPKTKHLFHASRWNLRTEEA